MWLIAIASLPSEKILSLAKLYNVSGFILINMINAEALFKCVIISLFRSILMVWRASWSPYYPHNVADFILYRNPYFSNVCKAENSAVLTADGSLAMDLGFVYFLAYRCPPHKLQHARLQPKIRNTSYITCRPDLYVRLDPKSPYSRGPYKRALLQCFCRRRNLRKAATIRSARQATMSHSSVIKTRSAVGRANSANPTTATTAAVNTFEKNGNGWVVYRDRHQDVALEMERN